MPLQSISFVVNIVEFCAEVEITQQYKNLSEDPLEAIYIFPMDTSAAVCKFGILYL
jgi:hypothetical protein